MKRANIINAQAHFDNNKHLYQRLAVNGDIEAYTFVYATNDKDFTQAKKFNKELKLARLVYVTNDVVLTYIESYFNPQNETERHEAGILHKKELLDTSTLNEAVEYVFNAMTKITESEDK